MPAGLRDHLTNALGNDCRWVRIGATLAIADTVRGEAAGILMSHAARLPTPPDASLANAAEHWAIALGLEWNGVDCTDMLAPILDMTPSDFTAALDRPFPDWLGAVGGKLGKVRFDRSLLPLELWTARHRRTAAHAHDADRAAGSGAITPPPTPHAVAAAVLKSELRRMPDFMKDDPEAEERVRVFGGIIDGLGGPDPQASAAAALKLREIVLTEPDHWSRQNAAEALAMLGAEASIPLLAVMTGGSPFALDPVQAMRICGDGDAERGLRTFGRPIAGQAGALGRFLALQGLTQFRDPDTAFAAVSAALAEPDAAAGWGAELLASMPVNCSFPALFWHAVSSDRASGRKARWILENIVYKEAYGIWHHVIGTSFVDADLTWIFGLIRSCETIGVWQRQSDHARALSWSLDQQATWLILHAGIVSMLATSGGAGALYSVPPTGHQFASYLDRRPSPVDSPRPLQESSGYPPPAKSAGGWSLPDFLSPKRWFWKKSPTVEQRRPEVSFPAQCALGKPCILRVQLRQETAQAAVAANVVMVPLPPGATQADILVIVRSDGFDVTPDYGTISVPVLAASTVAEFTLIGRRPGEHTVEVSFLLGVERIGYYCLRSTVAQRTSSRDASDVTIVEAPGDSQPVAVASSHAILFVDGDANGALGYAYQEADPAFGPPRKAGVAPRQPDGAAIQKWTSQQSQIIRGYLEHDQEAADLAGVRAGITAIGSSLFGQLTPPGLADIMLSWPAGAVIAIESNVHWIPWELMAPTVNGPLLGEHFQIVRLPRRPRDAIDGITVLPAARGAQDELLRSILVVVGDDIRKPDHADGYFAQATFGPLAPLARELVEGSWDELRTSVADADIVHFVCHGRTEPLYHLSYGSGGGRRLPVSQVGALSLKAGAVVFANACGSARPDLLLSELENFGFAFYASGARPFIGTLGPVPTTHAMQFAKRFYDWFIVRGLPASEALRQARIQSAAESKNLFWLFYSLYGSASACKRPALPPPTR